MKCKLLNPQGNIERSFATIAEAIEYCMEHKLCNSGWVRYSLKTGHPFYARTKPWKKTKYNGYGYKMIRA